MSNGMETRAAARPAQATSFARALCAVDGTDESIAAVEQAARIAGPDGLLTLLLVTSFRFMGEYRSPAIGPIDAEHLLQRTVAAARSTGVRCRVEVDPASPPSHVVLDWAAGHDMLAIGAPATSWFGGMFLGGVAAGAERSLVTPLLVGRPLPAARERPHVLVASDGLDGSDELVALAARIARGQQADATLVHAAGPEWGFHPRRIRRQARILEMAIDGSSDVRIEAGSPRALVTDTARAIGASLIVMGSRRLSGLHAVGSVSRRVVHNGDCPVLLVPPEQLAAAEALNHRMTGGEQPT
jgi:nucleotide-binding universal stress UspA family protein